MTGQQVNCFLVVARNMSFTKGAEELYMTQPAVSRHVRALEEELGLKLFDRSERSIKLTPAGELMQSCFLKCHAELSAAMQQAALLETHPCDKLTLGLMSGWDLGDLLPEVLSLLFTGGNNISLRIESYNYRELFSALADGEIDIALCNDLMTDLGDDLTAAPLAEIPCMLIFSASHPNAGQPNLSPLDFREEPFFLPPQREIPQAAAFIRACCRPYGFTPNIQFVRNHESMLDNVRNGLGVMIMGEWSRACADPHFQSLKLSSHHTVSMFWKKYDQNPLLPQLVEYARRVAAEKYSFGNP